MKNFFVKNLVFILFLLAVFDAQASKEEKMLIEWLDLSFDKNNLNWERTSNEFLFFIGEEFKESEDINQALTTISEKKKFRKTSFSDLNLAKYKFLHSNAKKTSSIIESLFYFLRSEVKDDSRWEKFDYLTKIYLAIYSFNSEPLNDNSCQLFAKKLKFLYKNVSKKVLADKLTVIFMINRIFDVGFEIDLENNNKDESGINDNDIVDFAEVEPSFLGGEEGLSFFIRQNIEYPKSSREMGDQGVVYVQFVVGRDGSIGRVKVVRGVTDELDKEAKRVISIMPRWRPGLQKGKAIRIRFTLPINFKLG